MNAIFVQIDVFLQAISRLHVKQSQHSLLMLWRVLNNFGVIFGYVWEEIVFLKGLLKLRKIRNIEYLT